MDILVHVSAPATVHHDKRHFALAQAVANFHPAIITRSDGEDSSASEEPLDQSSANKSAQDGRGVQNRNPLKRSRTFHTTNPNPPYRKPFRRDRNSLVAKDLTPLIRPRTAPEPSPSTIQVPRTHSEIRRAFSNPLQSTSSKVTDSQEHRSPEVSSDGRISSPLDLKGNIVVSLSQTSIDDHPPFKRARIQDRLSLSPTAIHLQGGRENSDVWQDSPNLCSSPPFPAAAGRALHSDASTATPSQPIHAMSADWPVQSQTSPKHPPSIISLSSGTTQRPAEGRQSFDQARMSSYDAPQRTGRDEGPPTPFPAIDDLPVEAIAPQPDVGEGKYSSHVTDHLQELIDRPQLHKSFRPLRVTRDVKVLERGYWLMDIMIAAHEIVRQARSSPTKEVTAQSYSDRFAGATAEERLAEFWQAKAAGRMTNYDYGHEDEAVGKWTEAEFLTFWDQFSAFVQRGRAGWAVRMVRADVDVEISHPASAMRQLRVRIFTWGEVISHIYLAIWICSGKLATRIPMKWVAGDGSVVVEMSGKKKYTGNLSSWIRKGPPGEEGCWGVADE